MSICAFSGTKGVHGGTPSPAGKQTGISGPTYFDQQTGISGLAHFANRPRPVHRPPTLTWIVQQQDYVIMKLHLELANTVNEYNRIVNTQTDTNTKTETNTGGKRKAGRPPGKVQECDKKKKNGVISPVAHNNTAHFNANGNWCPWPADDVLNTNGLVSPGSEQLIAAQAIDMDTIMSVSRDEQHTLFGSYATSGAEVPDATTGAEVPDAGGGGSDATTGAKKFDWWEMGEWWTGN
jgi:hypothetical protein